MSETKKKKHVPDEIHSILEEINVFESVKDTIRTNLPGNYCICGLMRDSCGGNSNLQLKCRTRMRTYDFMRTTPKSHAYYFPLTSDGNILRIGLIDAVLRELKLERDKIIMEQLRSSIQDTWRNTWRSGLCDNLTSIIFSAYRKNNGSIDTAQAKSLQKELFQHYLLPYKPDAAAAVAYWFPLTIEGAQSRLKIVDKALNLITNELAEIELIKSMRNKFLCSFGTPEQKNTPEQRGTLEQRDVPDPIPGNVWPYTQAYDIKDEPQTYYTQPDLVSFGKFLFRPFDVSGTKVLERIEEWEKDRNNGDSEKKSV